jgi:cyanate lyase
MAGSPRLLHHGVVANRGFDRIYRLYEIVAVHGTPIKELIHEEFGDGIMSAIDFSMDISREPDPKGDRVKVVMPGKFLPYKTY